MRSLHSRLLPVLIVLCAAVPADAGAAVRDRLVTFAAPLPADAGPHPAACDRLGYYRVRSTRGPRRARRADAVFATMPGYLGGAGSLLPFARHVVRASQAQGRHVEVWVLDRRANCLEDHTGLRQTTAANPEAAYDAAAAMTTRPAADTAWLADQGLARTLADWRTVILRLPERFRQRRLLCGGHSLGGLLTGQLADWDFDGDAATDADRGYRLCRGFFVLDSRLHIGRTRVKALSDGLAGLTAGLPGLPAASSAPYLDLPGESPAVLASQTAAAAAAAHAPDAPSGMLATGRRDPELDPAVRLAFARAATGLALPDPDPAALHLTNAAVLGAFYDDDSSPIGIARGSLGTFGGGPVARKDLLLPYDAERTLFGVAGGTAVAPTSTTASYVWRDRRRTPDPVEAPTDAPGQPYSSPAEEVSDLGEFARAYGDPRADGQEWYFPTKLLTDVFRSDAGDRTGDLDRSIPGGAVQRPAVYVDAANGFAPDFDDPDPPVSADLTHVTLPGYDHLDVGTAAYRQAGGRVEGTAAAVAAFGARLAPAVTRRRAR